MTPEEWWAKIDDVSAENAAKGIKLPEMTLDLTNGACVFRTGACVPVSLPPHAHTHHGWTM
jgi:hypothetical protein